MAVCLSRGSVLASGALRQRHHVQGQGCAGPCLTQALHGIPPDLTRPRYTWEGYALSWNLYSG